MAKCPRCDVEVYFGERKRSIGKDWHMHCLRCCYCDKPLTCGQHAEHDGEPFCHNPCYAKLYGPRGRYHLFRGHRRNPNHAPHVLHSYYGGG